MVSSSRLVVAVVLMIFGAAVSSWSQTTPEKGATASISGKVKLKDRAVAGVVVFAEEQNQRGWRQVSKYRATTDQSGIYKLTNIPAGTYNVTPVTPAFALDDDAANKPVVVNEGETVEDINFSIIPGGVITGRISDADGKPVIEENINIMPIDEKGVVSGRFDGDTHTDDRGIYRAFGLQPGKYKVFVGRNESLPEGARAFYRRTFYPSVTDEAKATLVEVTEGGEATNIDIIVGRPSATFKVSGRVVDAETGKPLVHLRYGVYQGYAESDGGASRVGQDFTDANGEFRLDNVLAGKYALFIVPENSGVRPDHVMFEVVDRDVTDLVIRAGKAATISGVVVFEGAEEAKPGFKFTNLFISGWAESGSAQRFSGGGFSRTVNADGSFKIGDLKKGRVRFHFSTAGRDDSRQVQLIRIERDGAVQSGGLMVQDGEQVTGVRLVVKHLTGAIHGQIKIEGEEWQNSRIAVWINYLDDEERGEPFMVQNSTPQVDSRKHFTVESLAAGTYEVNVAVLDRGRRETHNFVRQQVTVVDNAATDVTITIKPKP